MRVLGIAFIIFILVSNQGLTESMKEIRKQNEEGYFQIGYKPVEEAVKECEKHFNKKISLPYKIPPIPFTLMVGRCNDLEGDTNDSFEIEVIHMDSPHNHYMIRVKPVNYGLTFTNKKPTQSFKLDNSTIAFYYTKPIRGFNLLVFERDGWQYILNIDKRNAHKVPPETLVEIANAFR